LLFVVVVLGSRANLISFTKFWVEARKSVGSWKRRTQAMGKPCLMGQKAKKQNMMSLRKYHRNKLC